MPTRTGGSSFIITSITTITNLISKTDPINLAATKSTVRTTKMTENNDCSYDSDHMNMETPANLALHCSTIILTIETTFRFGFENHGEMDLVLHLL